MCVRACVRACACVRAYVRVVLASFFLLFFPSFSSLCKVVICIHLYQSKERGWNTGAGRWVDSLYYIFMKMKFVKEVAVSFLLLTHSCCLEENLDSAPPADTSGWSRRRSLCVWILILQRDTVTVKPIPKLAQVQFDHRNLNQFIRHGLRPVARACGNGGPSLCKIANVLGPNPATVQWITCQLPGLFKNMD